MSSASGKQYLDSKVFTASQPQLHLMLLEGALRFARQAKEQWDEADEFQPVDLLLARVADIVDELTHGAAAGSTEMSAQLEEQYAFIYRELAACRINHDMEKLDVCLKLLAYQRETWKLACEKLDGAEVEPTANPVPMPHTPMSPVESFSLEA